MTPEASTSEAQPDALSSATGYDAPEKNSPRSANFVPQGAVDITHRRRFLGYILGGLALLSFVLVAAVSIWTLHHIEPPKESIQERFVLFKLGAHAVVSVALIFFCYQLLRAAERMIIPAWWVEEHVESTKVMLGVEDPVSAASKLIEKLSALFPKINVGTGK